MTASPNRHRGLQWTACPALHKPRQQNLDAITRPPHRSPPRQLKIADDWLCESYVSIFSPYSSGLQTAVLAAKAWISTKPPQTYLRSVDEHYFPGLRLYLIFQIEMAGPVPRRFPRSRSRRKRSASPPDTLRLRTFLSVCAIRASVARVPETKLTNGPLAAFTLSCTAVIFYPHLAVERTGLLRWETFEKDKNTSQTFDSPQFMRNVFPR